MMIVTDTNQLRGICRADFVLTIEDILEMVQLLRETKAAGLAAPQVGIDARFFVTAWGEFFVNPEIVDADNAVYSVEGCLSLPEVTCCKRRWKTIRLADGRKYEGFQAVVIQHELDHLNGVLITDLRDSEFRV